MMCTCRLFGKNQDTQNMGHEIAFNIMSWKTVTVTNSLDQKKNLFSNVFNQTIKILLAKYSHLSIYNVLHFTEISNLLISQHN
jgi:hypothetical protein